MMPLRVICACVLFCILVAGLWPFHAPRNEVRWSTDENGLLFGKHGSILSASPIEANPSQTDKSCSLEIWLEPRRLSSEEGTVLAFYWPAKRVVAFTLRQYQNGLVLERESRGSSAWEATIYVGDVFRGPSRSCSRSARGRQAPLSMLTAPWSGRLQISN